MKKSTRILSIALMVIPSAMLVMSASMKIFHAKQLVEGLSRIGLSNFITLLGIIELSAVVLWWIPATSRVGFLLLCSYLGGAISIELTQGRFPSAAVFLAIAWIAAYLKNRSVFVPVSHAQSN